MAMKFTTSSSPNFGFRLATISRENTSTIRACVAGGGWRWGLPGSFSATEISFFTAGAISTTTTGAIELR
jgi:hypothetical protein